MTKVTFKLFHFMQMNIEIINLASVTLKRLTGDLDFNSTSRNQMHKTLNILVKTCIYTYSGHISTTHFHIKSKEKYQKNMKLVPYECKIYACGKRGLIKHGCLYLCQVSEFISSYLTDNTEDYSQKKTSHSWSLCSEGFIFPQQKKNLLNDFSLISVAQKSLEEV